MNLLGYQRCPTLKFAPLFWKNIALVTAFCSLQVVIHPNQNIQYPLQLQALSFSFYQQTTVWRNGPVLASEFYSGILGRFQIKYGL